MPRNWNDVLRYIKRSVGAELNLLELSDEEIIEGLKEDVLGKFSNHSPFKKFTIIDSNHILPISEKVNNYIYVIPTQENEDILDIYDVYFPSSTEILPDIGSLMANSYFGVMDLIISNSMIDAIKSVGVQNTWEFIPPKYLSFDKPIETAIVVYNVPHTDLSTIRPDLYSEIFKPMCLANVLYRLLKLRSKYETLNTPFGPINLNVQNLENEYNNLTEEIKAKLLSLPPDHLITII